MSNDIPAKYKCPNCNNALVWSNDNAYRPFCSSQCKNTDLISWADEKHVIEGVNMLNDLMSDELDAAQLLADNIVSIK